MAGLTVRTRLPAVSSAAFLLACAADDAECAGVVHSTASQSKALIRTIKSGFLGLANLKGQVVRTSFKDSWWMFFWFLLTSSRFSKWWPFSVLVHVLSPFFETLPSGTEASICTVFERAGVERRASWAEPEKVYPWLSLHPEPVMDVLRPQLLARLLSASQKVLGAYAAAGGSASQVTHLVVGSATILTLAPGIEVRVVEELGLDHGVQRLPLSPSLGCGGGARAFSIGARMAVGHPEAVVLVLYGDILSLQVHSGLPTYLTAADIFNTAVHGDGAAAALIVGSAVAKRCAQAGATVYKVESISSHNACTQTMDLAYTTGKARWGLDGLKMPALWQTNASRLDDFARDGVPAFANGMADKFQKETKIPFTVQDLDALLMHPTETQLRAMQQKLNLTEGHLQHSRAVLRSRGNMSGCTVLQALARWMEGAEQAADEPEEGSEASTMGASPLRAMLLGFSSAMALDGAVITATSLGDLVDADTRDSAGSITEAFAGPW